MGSRRRDLGRVGKSAGGLREFHTIGWVGDVIQYIIEYLLSTRASLTTLK